MSHDAPSNRGYGFPKSHRLLKRQQFDAVHRAKAVKNAGPLRVHGRPNGLDHCRLGLSVPRRVGKAVRRNRIKRCLREAFRLTQHELPPGYDLVVVVRPHEPMKMDSYQRLLKEAAGQLDLLWHKRRSRRAEVAADADRSTQEEG